MLFCISVGFEDVATEDSRQNSSAERRSEQLVLSPDKDIADSSFGNLISFIEKDYVVEAAGAAFRVVPIVEFAARRLMTEEYICR